MMESVGSLPVANVQALAAASSGLSEVPPRYLRPEAESDPVTGDGGSLEIPVIDMNRLLQPQSSRDESAKLNLACEQWGFFQLINHNVPNELIGRMKIDIEEFFKLPLEVKEQFAQLPGNLEGYGQLFVVSEDQKLDWADILYFNTQPLNQRNVRFWPTQPLTFRATLDEYSQELKNTADCLLGLMAKNLGLNPEILTEMTEEGIQSVRINYYPPCPQADKVLGLSPHSDGDLITLVLQVNQVQGLQIKKNGKWVPVKPLPGAFIVNVGDIFEIFSNGRYKSIEHRAVVSTGKERLSVAAFHSPNNGAMIGPLPQLARGSEVNYRTVDHENFMKLFFSARLDGKSFLDRMKL
ncbi:S-norcoclaurine synthase 1-like [Phoenix dactylifera]|uniref:S-norcoclaurine synthase 1-like n=1 Tax=Phoenix dactylifera TaxID=42345 RepID=A0A8B7CN82_PHODC|nr:S-norcoclaurine synthase 1-like [Phoenix dactylifera]